jgi:large subunit ribosomal protein L9
MQVILCEDVDNLGEMGQIVQVKDGYARNYLIPRKKAVTANSGSARQLEHHMRIIKVREEKRRAEQQKVAKVIEKLTVDIKVRAGEGDRIFGSVTTGHIADQLAVLGHEISRKSILLEEPIKSLGIFMVPVKLPGGVEAKVKVWVTAIKEESSAESDDSNA